MNRNLKTDLEALEELAFRRLDVCGDLLKGFHEVREDISDKLASPEDAWRVYDWLKSPFSLWPIDFVGLAQNLLETLRKRSPLDSDMQLLLNLLPPPPTPSSVIAAHEHAIAGGAYDNLVKCSEKFEEMEVQLKEDAEIGAAWREIRQRFPVEEHTNRQGVIRRTLSHERNLRDVRRFDWAEARFRFSTIFDVFCYRWNLYGIERDRPLLLKLTVNPTPYGTMIFIPRYWSFDRDRDLAWGKVSRLHRAHGAIRQGPKLSPGRLAKHREAEAAVRYSDEARKLGFRGERRLQYILTKLKKDSRTDPSCINRLLREGRARLKRKVGSSESRAE